MRQWNFIAWLLSGALMPLFRSLFENKAEPTPEMQTVSAIYGYLVICGVIFNVAVLIAFISEVLL